MQHFNLDTMSGVFPGRRTQIFQRIRLRPINDDPSSPVWAQLLWAEDGESCALHLYDEAQGWSARAWLEFSVPKAALLSTLHARLAVAGWRPEICGGCGFWQPAAATTGDGLPAGRCRWAPPGQDASAANLSIQGCLALACPHWQPGQAAGKEAVAALPHDPVQAMRKVADISESKLRFWARWRNRVRRWLRPGQRKDDEPLIERSGVGAGTAPCFVCQGRIANLGALAAETPDGDRQTFSIWRCRNCYTTYLNDWIDRWERLDSLDTEESYYRIAPNEALALLAIINSVAGGEHPGRRRQRSDQRSRLLQFIAGRASLSHQVRQGR
jgi:hypothetical protein